jgi:hypothetical protein
VLPAALHHHRWAPYHHRRRHRRHRHLVEPHACVQAVLSPWLNLVYRYKLKYPDMQLGHVQAAFDAL